MNGESEMNCRLLKTVSAAALLALLAYGCGKSGEWAPTMENPPQVKFKYLGKDTPVQDLKDDDVIVAVNGEALTKKEFYARMSQVAWTIRRSPGMRASNFADAYAYAGRTLIPRFVRETIIAQAGRGEKLATADEIRAKVDEKVERFCKMYRIDRNAVKKEFPGGLCAVQRDAERTVWLKTYVDKHAIKGKLITAETVTNILNQIAAENAATSASNAAIRAKLEGLRGDILSGKATFEDVADKYSEGIDNEGGGYWGRFGREGLPDADLIFELKVGSISEVLEDDDSYYMVRLEERTAAKRDANKRVVEPESVSLSRIQLLKHELTILASPGTLKEDLQAQMDENALEAHLGTLMEKAEIVYPHGTNFWAVAEKGANK